MMQDYGFFYAKNILFSAVNIHMLPDISFGVALMNNKVTGWAINTVV